jgi:hypothetical protein
LQVSGSRKRGSAQSLAKNYSQITQSKRPKIPSLQNSALQQHRGFPLGSKEACDYQSAFRWLLFSPEFMLEAGVWIGHE